MHATATLDLEWVVAGEIELELEDGCVRLGPGDCVIQRGTQHRWRVVGDGPCTYIVAMFALVAAIPAVIVAIIAGLTLSIGLDRWFEMRTKNIIGYSMQIADAYVRENARNLQGTTLSMAFHMGSRTSQDFYTADLVSDLLSGGDSSRLYKHLVQEQRLLASVNAYISGDVDPGLFVFTGQLLPDTTPEQAEAAFRAEIEALQSVPASDYEVEKVKNKFEANTLFGELNVMNKAMNLGFYEMLGDLPLVNGEVAAYRAVTTGDILAFSRRTFRPENCSILIYKAKK